MFYCSLCDAPNPAWVGVKQLAQLLKVDEYTVREKCRKGLIPGAEKVPGQGAKGHWRVPTAKAIQYVQEHPS